MHLLSTTVQGTALEARDRATRGLVLAWRSPAELEGREMRAQGGRVQ
jgi:Fe-S cluster assembly ATPase SufC